MFNQDDFLLLENIILKTSGERIKSKVQQFETEEDRFGCYSSLSQLQKVGFGFLVLKRSYVVCLSGPVIW